MAFMNPFGADKPETDMIRRVNLGQATTPMHNRIGSFEIYKAENGLVMEFASRKSELKLFVVQNGKELAEQVVSILVAEGIK